ncbi:hypothetical protein CYLTODRAFT_48323 [Cylindrobasidium torrendii FP15055 ss-10]|uniref:Uncharacterized protein n=1 Tax=Cylindrobasidium torrendii FP15055 ss-10 TaxID=1314674 RepID=A0A0D7B8Y9_9AGAR|nr:hypothetical protein CYLTODRAFT_48323 [Cylindrobasidium torrendii FP15055 ss-10]
MTSSDGTPPSFDAEMLGDIKQQHALELSSMQSRIRSLESAVFEAEARAHELQKQLTDSRQNLLSPPPGSAPSRPTSRTGAVVSPPPMTRTFAIDQSLSPEARHKRKVSLSMLKARIERESGKKLETVPDEHNTGLPFMHSHHARRPQFLDDSHVFWCSSCKGDLVIL